MFLLKPQDATRQAVERVATPSILPRPQGVRMVAHEWKYVAEGGANVLFRHHPAVDAEPNAAADLFRGKLLRVKKCDAVVKLKKRKSKCVLATSSYPAHYPHPLQVLEYATNDILPYLVQQTEAASSFPDSTSRSKWFYDQVAQLMEVEKCFLTDLNEQLLRLESRPEHRRQSQIDVELQCVMLLPDVTLPPPDDNSLSIIEPPSVRDSRVNTLEDGSGSTTEQTDEDVADQLAEEMEAILHEPRQRGDSIDEAGSSSWVSTSTTSSSSGDDAATADDLDEHGGDADASENEDDGPEDERDDTVPIPPEQRPRLPSTGCDVFDCCFRNICVEIKPKIGFKPSGHLIPEIKQRVCRFCMHQHFKRSTGKVEEISEFCPLDLYSRNPDRIRRAFRALQRTPQNNFKVFVRSNNDAVVNIITGMNADALPKGVAQAKYSCKRKRMGFRHSCQSIGAESELELDFDSPPVGDRLLPDVMELLTEVLMNLEILEDLKKMQQLDHISVDGMWHLQKLLQRLRDVAPEVSPSSPTTPMLGDLVDSFLADNDCQQADDDLMRPGSTKRSLAFLDVALTAVSDVEVTKGATSWKELSLSAFEAFFSQLVRRFQVATTLKDCSLLLCLRRVDSGNAVNTVCASSGSVSRAPRKRFDHLQEYEHVVMFRNMAFHCVIAVVDLDVKSHKSVDDYYQLDEKIVQHFAAAFGHRVDLECED